ncbi:BTB/POZ domain-containing protein 22 [Elsinoe australis]|uniref:BTB/POZ domain-containing protein 22 n=1 Tax=Elsinoe australis TaxID=40998 RepID=A0A4U7AVY0_9PEZI|nr:BTB/POZ domain-containing protein 22 [Elsinoe australis]
MAKSQTPCPRPSLVNPRRPADVVIRTTEGPISVHEIMLATASTVFDAELSSNFKESVTREIDMTYEDADSVRIMVDHIYDRDLNLGTKNIDQLTTLYMLADMKQIPTLTATVIQTLESRDFDLSDGDTTVSLAKALKTIYSVQMTNADAFKSCLLTIAASRPSDFLKHPDLVVLAADNPQIRQDLCTRMSSLVEIVHLRTCHSCGRIVDGHAPQKDAYAINVYRDNCKHCKRPVTPTRIEEFQVECKPKKYFGKPTVSAEVGEEDQRVDFLKLPRWYSENRHT